MHRVRSAFVFSLLWLLSLSSLSAADPQAFRSALRQGLDLYHKGDLVQAEAQFLQAEKSASDDTERAKARYHMGLIYYKQREWDRALSAFETAQRLDPKIGFTREKEQFREKLSNARANVSVPASKQGPSAPQSSDPIKSAIVKALVSSERGGLWDFANFLSDDQRKDIESRIRKAAKKDVYLYVFTVDTREGGRVRETLTEQVFRERAFRKGEVLIIANRTGVSAKAADISDAYMRKHLQESVRYFQKSYGDGVAFLTDLLTAEISGARTKKAAGRNFLILVALGVAGAIVLAILAQRRRKEAKFAAAYGEAVRMESEALEQLDIIKAREKLTDDKKLNSTLEEIDKRYWTAHDLLEKLKESGNGRDVQRAESVANLFRGILSDLERIRAGEEPVGHSSANAAARGSSYEPVESVEPPDGNCFFCSNPVHSQTAEKVKITLGDQEQWVLMCQHCSDYYRRTGQMPKVLTRNYQGQQVHWKDDPGYTPPAQPQPMLQQGMGGLGGMGWLDLWMLSTIFNRPQQDRVIFVDRDTGGRGQHPSYDVDEQRSRSAAANYRHEASADSDDRNYRTAPSADFFERDRS